MPTFVTPNRHGYNVQFSPFDPCSLVVASSQLYGLAGGGTLYYLHLKDDTEIMAIGQFEWSDGLFDVVWSKSYSTIVATSSGDGCVQLWNTDHCSKNVEPVVNFRAHKNEIYSIDWSKLSSEEQILTASWDGSIKLWDANRATLITPFEGHSDLIYSALFSELIPNLFCSVSIDGTLNLWNSLDVSGKPILSVKASSHEILTSAWSSHDHNLLATGGSDGLIRGWDIRKLTPSPIFELNGTDEFAVRRIKFSPHSSNILASANYDFTTRIWHFEKQSTALEEITNHSEFVCGIDWSPHSYNLIADCGWDSLVNVFAAESLESS